jgi:glycosyltransferase involved in cell wall biosynthesis
VDVDAPAVTVVIPTHNRHRLLLRTLRSVSAQRDVDLRVVVVDDGGSDGSTEAVLRLGRDDVSVVRHNEARGVSAARNSGLSAVETPWVAFVDDDDLWAPQKLSAQLAALHEQPDAGWCSAGAVRIDSSLRVVSHHPAPGPGDVSGQLLMRNTVPGGGSGVLVSAALAREVNGFDEKISIVADWDFYLRLSLRSPAAAANRPLVGHYLHADSMYYDPEGIIRELFYMGRKYADLPQATAFHAHPATWFVHFALMASRLGNRRTAARLVMTGLRDAGVAAMAAEVFSRVGPKVRRGLAREAPLAFEFDRTELEWLAAFAEDAQSSIES